MKKLLVLIVLGGAGFLTYKYVFAQSDAYSAYARFADALLVDHWDDARELTDSGPVLALISKREAVPAAMGRETYRNLRGVVHMGPFRTIESEKASPDGKTVTLKVIQVERAGPVTMGPVGKPTVRHTQNVVMVRSEKGWMVDEFDEEIEPLDDR